MGGVRGAGRRSVRQGLCRRLCRQNTGNRWPAACRYGSSGCPTGVGIVAPQRGDGGSRNHVQRLCIPPRGGNFTAGNWWRLAGFCTFVGRPERIGPMHDSHPTFFRSYHACFHRDPRQHRRHRHHRLRRRCRRPDQVIDHRGWSPVAMSDPGPLCGAGFFMSGEISGECTLRGRSVTIP